MGIGWGLNAEAGKATSPGAALGPCPLLRSPAVFGDLRLDSNNC